MKTVIAGLRGGGAFISAARTSSGGSSIRRGRDRHLLLHVVAQPARRKDRVFQRRGIVADPAQSVFGFPGRGHRYLGDSPLRVLFPKCRNAASILCNAQVVGQAFDFVIVFIADAALTTRHVARREAQVEQPPFAILVGRQETVGLTFLQGAHCGLQQQRPVTRRARLDQQRVGRKASVAAQDSGAERRALSAPATCRREASSIS